MNSQLSTIETYFCLYACCIPVKGFTRSTICDLQRDSYVFIPNSFFEILTEDLNRISVDQLAHEMGDDSVWAWLNMLIENEYGYYTKDYQEFKNLKAMDLSYYEASRISNSIIDFDSNSNHDVKTIFNQLSNLVCEAVELRFFYPENIKHLKEILSLTSRTTFRSVEVLIEYHPSYTAEVIHDLFTTCFRLRKLTFHSYSDTIIKEINEERMLIFTDDKITSEHHCGVVSPHLMTSNLFIFSESQKNNSCLNRKISIDKAGNIKNCPSHQITYGKISDTSLLDVVNLPAFKKVWNISKDMIDVCKDCEFRHMCLDCRAYVKEPGNDLSKPLKCNYDPYEAVWN
jgi:SPASM domain peptide maturase of grasp-with-spasm system